MVSYILSNIIKKRNLERYLLIDWAKKETKDVKMKLTFVKSSPKYSDGLEWNVQSTEQMKWL